MWQVEHKSFFLLNNSGMKSNQQSKDASWSVVSVTTYFFKRKAFQKLKHYMNVFSILFCAQKHFIAINNQQTKQASVTQLPSGEQIITKRGCQNFLLYKKMEI